MLALAWPLAAQWSPMSELASDTPRPSLPESPIPFADLGDRLAAGDEAVAREVHARYTPRLVALARQKLAPAVRGRVDPESVVQSVYRSFFGRANAGEFALGDWDDLWGLLARITLRKCLNRARFHQQECRDVGREVGGSPPGTDWAMTDGEPSPYEVAVLH